MKYSFKIFSVFNIPVELHISFLLLMALIYGVALFNLVPGVDLNAALLITLLFVTVILHELAHSYVAQRYGIGIERIVLLPIGGVSAMEALPDDPGQEFRISIAGPLVNILIAIICYGLFFGLAQSYPTIAAFLNYFALVNVILGAFNLIPAYPMDGGESFTGLSGRENELPAGHGNCCFGGQVPGHIHGCGRDILELFPDIDCPFHLHWG